jgi:uncharacterized protein with ParB-like and HNH nuclease domain
MSETIDSKDISFGTLYEGYYSVPNYQREYVWGKNEVEQMLNDIYNEFEFGEALPKNMEKREEKIPEYFLGSIVVCRADAGGNRYELVDGQQRTTTSFLLLCGIRDHLKNLGDGLDELLQKISSKSTNSEGEEEFMYRLDLQYEDSGSILRDIASFKYLGAEISINDADTLSIKNIKSAYNDIMSFLCEKFQKDGRKLRRFYWYFINKVKIIRITTGSVNHALKIFETINDRGKALDSMDLLKNLMFVNAKTTDFNNLKSEWKKLTDLLYLNKEKPLRFLRYFIFANYHVDELREDGIYDWLSKNADLCGYKKDSKAYVTILNNQAVCYTNFMKGLDAQGQFNRYVDNIRHLSGTARQHFILLLAGSHLPTEAFNQLAKNIENLFFAYVISREPTKEFERLFAKWANEIRLCGSLEEINKFIANNIQPQKEQLSSRFRHAFTDLTTNAIQQYRMRYIIGKLAQFIDERAFPNKDENQKLTTFIQSTNEVEHILPQNPKDEALLEFFKNSEFEGLSLEEKRTKSYEYIIKLGNLTLIEKTFNSSLGNNAFSVKHPVYGRIGFILTNSIYDQSKIGKNTSFDRTIELLKPFPEWNPQSTTDRQKMLTDLAHLVWDMPIPK